MASIHYRDSGDYGYEGAQAPHTTLGEAHTASIPPNSMQRWVNLAGAATSAALICGVVVWGYQLAVRDVSGVPVVRALEGPARIAPEDPGGDLARHVGLSVNAVAGSGTAAPAPDRVVLAPESVELAAEDLPMAEYAAQPVTDPTPVTTSEARVETVAFQSPASESALSEPTAPETAAEPEVAPSESPASGIIPASVPGLNRSPRPVARPSVDLVAEAAARAVAGSMGGAQAAPLDIDPASLATGTRLVQLGAFDTPDQARNEWTRVADRFEALMDGKQRVIQEASSGGRTFYRLRVHGFGEVTEARRFCAALQAEGTNCIPALVR